MLTLNMSDITFDKCIADIATRNMKFLRKCTITYIVINTNKKLIDGYFSFFTAKFKGHKEIRAVTV